MKTPRIANAVGHIDDNLITDATKSKKAAKKNLWLKWVSFAACFSVILITAVAVPTLFGDTSITPSVNNDVTVPEILNEDTVTDTRNETAPMIDRETSVSYSGNGSTIPATTADVNYTSTAIGDAVQATGNNELAFSQAYFYNVSDGEFSTYVSGKVIAEDKIGSILGDVSVTAGWKNNDYEWISRESLHAEVYLINGISKDVAVALKFIDKGDALTTTHYYVIMNPHADLTAVQDYVIAPIAPNKSDNEFGEETTVNEFAGEETVVEYTVQE